MIRDSSVNDSTATQRSTNDTPRHDDSEDSSTPTDHKIAVDHADNDAEEFVLSGGRIKEDIMGMGAQFGNQV